MNRVLGLAGVIATLAGCGMLSAPQPQRAPIQPGPLAPIVRAPGGALVECRGVPQEQCLSFASDGQEAGVVRLIVTCTSTCTPIKGDVRIDVLHPDGTVSSAGDGGYASAEAN